MISAGVMIAKVIWNIMKTVSGMVVGDRRVAAAQREGRAQSMPGDQAQRGQVADIGVAVAERQAVADDDPDHRDDAGDGEALHHGGEHVLLADHAGVEQRQAGDGHHQHQRGGGQHPGGIAGVDLRAFVLGQRAGRQGDRPQHRRKQRNSEGKQTAHYGQILSN